VYTDAKIVMGVESADLFFDCWYLKVIMLTDGVKVVSLTLQLPITSRKVPCTHFC
jgi:hypothetical protein